MRQRLFAIEAPNDGAIKAHHLGLSMAGEIIAGDCDAGPGDAVKWKDDGETQHFIEPVLLEEINHVSLTRPVEILLLNEKLKIILARQRRLREWMIWQALYGKLTVTTGPSSEIFIDYGFYSQPTSSIPWTDRTNADPIADLRSAREQMYKNSQAASIEGDVRPKYAEDFYMTSERYGDIARNEKVKNYLGIGDAFATPNKGEIERLISDDAQIIIYDVRYNSEYVPSGDDTPGERKLVRYLKTDKVLCTARPDESGEELIHEVIGWTAVFPADPEDEIEFVNGPWQGLEQDKMGLWLRAGVTVIPVIPEPAYILPITVTT